MTTDIPATALEEVAKTIYGMFEEVPRERVDQVFAWAEEPHEDPSFQAFHVDIVAEMRAIAEAAIRAYLNSAPKWQDIASAPKDGTRIILWTRTDLTDSGREYVETVCEGEHVYVAQVGRWEDATTFDKAGWHKELIGEPTHWQPLPEEPHD